MKRAVRAPVVHFVVLGACLCLVFDWWRPLHPGSGRDGSGERSRIVLAAADVEQLRQDWKAQYGTLPGPTEEDALIDRAVEEEVLHREALALGLHRDDRVVRARLAQLGRYLSSDPSEEDSALVQEVRSLGLDQRDVIVRRYLTQMMRLLLAKPQRSDLPNESELEAYLQQHAELFSEPEQVRLTHVYLSAARRGAAIDEQAAKLLAELRHAGTGPEAAQARGDPFVWGAQVSLGSGARLERIFGPGFAKALADVTPRTWAGPVHSSYGLHLVWIHERIPASVPPLDAVRNQVLHRFLRERSAAQLRTRVQALRARYQVTVERSAGASRVAAEQ